jgi:hypothetical protein
VEITPGLSNFNRTFTNEILACSYYQEMLRAEMLRARQAQARATGMFGGGMGGGGFHSQHFHSREHYMIPGAAIIPPQLDSGRSHLTRGAV